jgi:glycosyltransferase involved in cell wall biosynthesis
MTIAFIGSARYRQPLDRTSEKKFCALQRLGRLFVIGFSQDMFPRKFTACGHFYLFPGLPSAVMRYGEMFLFGPILALWLILRHGVRVLVAQSPYEGFAAALAKKAAGFLGVKVALIIESHGDFEGSIFLQRRILFPKLYRFLMRKAAIFSFSQADLLRAISDFTRRQLAQWAPGKQIHQFPTWTDMEVFSQAGEERNEAASQDILYVGALIPRKGLHHLIAAFAGVAPEFPAARLVLLGSQANRRYAAELKQQVNRLRLDEKTRFVGELSQVELAARMRKARVFVLPSISEGLGRVVFEAMACGTPVIGSRVDGIVDMIEDGKTGFLVPPADEIALADRLRWVLEHPQEAQVMGRRGRAFAEAFFSAGSYFNAYAKLLESAVAIGRQSTRG